jgi:hypothetical protein
MLACRAPCVCVVSVVWLAQGLPRLAGSALSVSIVGAGSLLTRHVEAGTVLIVYHLYWQCCFGAALIHVTQVAWHTFADWVGVRLTAIF